MPTHDDHFGYGIDSIGQSADGVARRRQSGDNQTIATMPAISVL
jgi:hypothetical protein